MDTLAKMAKQVEKLEYLVAGVEKEIAKKEQLKADYLGQIKGLQSAMKITQKDAEIEAKPPPPLREGTNIHKAMLLLSEQGDYMPVPMIVEGIGLENNKRNCVNIRSQLTQNAKAKRVFVRGENSTFGLIDWGMEQQPKPNISTDPLEDDWLDSRQEAW